MKDSTEEKPHHLSHNIKKDIIICVKCGSSNVVIENEDITCKDCGWVKFYEISDDKSK